MSFYVLIRGPLGCGKSTISKKIAELINAEYINIDEILAKYELDQDKEDGYISQKSFKKANELISPYVKSKLSQKQPVVIDGNFYWESQIKDLNKRIKYPYYIFTLKAPLKTCIKRDAQRNPPHGEEAAEAVFLKVTEFDIGALIDVTKPLETSVNEIISLLPKK